MQCSAQCTLRYRLAPRTLRAHFGSPSQTCHLRGRHQPLSPAPIRPQGYHQGAVSVLSANWRPASALHSVPGRLGEPGQEASLGRQWWLSAHDWRRRHCLRAREQPSAGLPPISVCGWPHERASQATQKNVGRLLGATTWPTWRQHSRPGQSSSGPIRLPLKPAGMGPRAFHYICISTRWLRCSMGSPWGCTLGAGGELAGLQSILACLVFKEKRWEQIGAA